MTLAVQPDLFEGDCFEAAVGTCIHFRLPDPTPVVLAAVHSDPRASHVAARRVLRVAITECAARHQGRVHVAWFRCYLPEWIDPHAVGAAISGWTKAGYLEAIPDQWESNGGGSNAAKPTQVRRLVKSIPPITR